VWAALFDPAVYDVVPIDLPHRLCVIPQDSGPEYQQWSREWQDFVFGEFQDRTGP